MSRLCSEKAGSYHVPLEPAPPARGSASDTGAEPPRARRSRRSDGRSEHSEVAERSHCGRRSQWAVQPQPYKRPWLRGDHRWRWLPGVAQCPGGARVPIAGDLTAFGRPESAAARIRASEEDSCRVRGGGCRSTSARSRGGLRRQVSTTPSPGRARP